MRRRPVLATTGLALSFPLAGCLATAPGGGARELASDATVETEYPTFSTYYFMRVGTDVQVLPEGTPIHYEDLTHPGKIAFINSLIRDGYYLDGTTARRLNRNAIEYQGELFAVSVGVADMFTPPEHGPEGDENWREPVDFGAVIDISEDTLTISIMNVMDTTLAIHHSGEPYFGVLAAVGESTSHLDHPKYQENDAITTWTVARMTEKPGGEVEHLEPTGVLSETYELPPAFSTPNTVWLSVPIGDDSTDRLGNRKRRVSVRFEFE